MKFTKEVKTWDYLFFCVQNKTANMREIVHMQAGQCGNQIGAKVSGF